jgi:hypothetical protein
MMLQLSDSILFLAGSPVSFLLETGPLFGPHFLSILILGYRKISLNDDMKLESNEQKTNKVYDTVILSIQG